MLLVTAVVLLQHAALQSLHVPAVARAPHRRAAVARAVVVADEESSSSERSASLLGSVRSVTEDGLIAIQPEARELAKVGSMVRFDSGCTGVLIAERCGFYFAGAIDGAPPAEAEQAVLLPRNLTVSAWSGDDEEWGGVYDFLGRDTSSGAPTLPDADETVFRADIAIHDVAGVDR